MDMTKRIVKSEATALAGLRTAQFLALSRELKIVPVTGWKETAAGRRVVSFFRPEDVDRIVELRRRKLDARSVAATKARWGRRPEEKKRWRSKKRNRS
jgi:hypothetical protein